ncbi:MAG TPA: DUF6398 domain-containing protein [Acetobacteraceae bacterium]|nr:DUF6398 domain-containing protein [Acetobacteraceae bacterium]
MTDAFCRDRLNDEYAELARAMAAALARKRPSPLASGQVRTWACSIVYTLGQINFLPDKAFQPYMPMAEVCGAFGVGQSTAMAKAKVIRTALKVNWLDPRWILRDLARRNPVNWLVQVDGFLVDVRDVAAAE